MNGDGVVEIQGQLLIPSFSLIFKGEELSSPKPLTYVQPRSNGCQLLPLDNLDRYRCYQIHCILNHADNIPC